MIPLMLATTAATPAQPAPDPRPEPLDSVIAAIRPSGRRIGTIIVAQDGTGDFSTLAEAQEESNRIQSEALARDGMREATPNHRVEIIIKPGVYDAYNYHPAPWSATIGYGADQVTLKKSALAGDSQYLINIGGRQYFEGFTMRGTPETLRYLTHNRSAGTTIWAAIDWFPDDITETWPGTQWRVSGNDGESGGTVLWYRNRLAGVSASHGWDTQGADAAPQHIIYVDCETSADAGFRSGSGGSGLSPDETWIVASEVQSVQVLGPNATLHLDPNTIVRSGTITAPPRVDQDTRWPIPFGGLSPRDRERYGLPPVDTTPPAGTPGY